MSEIKNSEIMETVKNNIARGLDLFDQEAIRRGIEIWRPIKEYPNYEVSSKGIVMNIKFGKTLKHQLDKDGYCYIGLSNDTKRKFCKIHRLVGNAFIFNPDYKPCIDHINNVKTDNNVANLRWATIRENGQNRTINKNSTSNVKGVSFHKPTQKWCVQIMGNCKKEHVGLYKTLEEAKIARQLKSKEIQGEFQNACEKV